MKKFTGLARISSVTQLAKGNSLKDQATSITEYAKKLGGEVEEIAQIQCSGKKMTLSSSILSKILLDAKMKKREVILSKLDRLSRDEFALHQIKRTAQEIGVQIHLVSLGKTIQEMSSLEFSMLAMFAQHERETIQNRVKSASKKSDGSFGKLIDAKEANLKSVAKRRNLANDWAKQAGIVEEIKKAILLLRKPTLQQVACILNGRGIQTRTGKEWTHGTLQQTMKRLNLNLRELISSTNLA